MQAAGRLAGSVLVDEGLRPELLSVLFIPEGGKGLPGRWQGRQFDWRDLPSCTGTVQFGLPGDSPPLLVVADVRVRAGVENRDPHLQDVDLRGRLTWIQLDLVDEGGNGVTEASVLELPAGGLAGRETVPGSVEILTDRPALDLLVQAPGYQWSILRGVRESREVVLRRAGTIRLRIPSLPALPEGVHLGVSLTLPGQEEALAPWNRTALFSAAGEASLASPGPGEYRLQLFYQSSAGRVRTRRPAAEGVLLAPLLRVEEEAREAPFTLAVDPARLLAGAEAMP